MGSSKSETSSLGALGRKVDGASSRRWFQHTKCSVNLTRAVRLSTQGQARGGAMAVACPTLWGHVVRQSKDHLPVSGLSLGSIFLWKAAPRQGTGY